jgi:transposase
MWPSGSSGRAQARRILHKTTETAGPRGYDAGKKVKGRKRHLLTDTNGLPVAAVVHPADIQDRDGAPLVLASARFLYPWLRHVFADGAYSGAKLDAALDKSSRWTIEIVKRSDAAGDLSCCPGAGGRAHLCLAQPQPPPRQRLRGHDRERPGVAISRQRQTTHATHRKNTAAKVLI